MKLSVKRANRYFQLLYSQKPLYLLLFLWVVAWLFGLHHRFIENDECVLGEYSYYFLHEGVVKLKTIPEILTWDERLYSHHRFFTWYGAFIIQVFGWSITALKSSILPFFGLFFILLYKYFQLEKFDNRYFLTAALIVFTSPIILLKSFSYRPDILLMAEGMAIIFFLRKYRLSKEWRFALFAGAVAGLSFLTHLNGVAFCIAGFFFLVIRKEYKSLVPYVGAGVLVGGLYFIEFLSPGVFEAYIYELTHWPTVNHGENYIGGGGVMGIIEGRFLKLLSEHRRFFWGDNVIAFSVLFFISLVFGFKYLKQKVGDALLFLLLLVLSLNIFGSHVAERYVLFYYGPMAVISAVALMHWLEKKRTWKVLIWSLAVILQFVFAIKMVIELRDKSYPTVQYHADILDKIPNEEKPKILGPYELIYNELPDYDLYCYKTYEYLEESSGEVWTQKALFEKAHSLNMEYIIISDRMAEYPANWFFGWKIVQSPLYEQYFKDDFYLILKRKDQFKKNLLSP